MKIIQRLIIILIQNITSSTGEKLVHRKIEFALRYHVPNKHKNAEAYGNAFYVLSLSQ